MTAPRSFLGTRPAENPAVSAHDYALTLVTVGDPDAPLTPSRVTSCPTCGGRGRLDAGGRAVSVSAFLAKHASQPCARCDETGKVSALSLNELARKWTGSPDFTTLTVDPGGVKSYRPSLYTAGRPEVTVLADAYDAVQIARCDNRRVYRG